MWSILVVDTSGPLGAWYLKTWYRDYILPHRLFTLTINITYDSSTSTHNGYLLNEEVVNDEGRTQQIGQIRWDQLQRRLVFCRTVCVNGSAYYEWYNGTIVEGILVGRFSRHQNDSRERRFSDYAAYRNHFTGWNSNYIDRNDIVPRVYDIVLDADYRGILNNRCHGLLRLDRSRSRFIGRLKVYRVGSYNAESENRTEFPLTEECSPNSVSSICGEELEYDLNVTRWDGNIVEFSRRDERIPQRHWRQDFRGGVSGQSLSGTFSHTGMSQRLRWRGVRAQILTYGLVKKPAAVRHEWQQRTRHQLYHLMMAGNPMPIRAPVIIRGSETAPINEPSYQGRDDNTSAYSQNYRLTELSFEYSLPNPYDTTSPFNRKVHGWLAVPTVSPTTKGFPAVLAVNGHSGSAKLMMSPGSMYWYGDSFARRGFVVLAIDISHRGYIDENLINRHIANGDLPSSCRPEIPYPPYGPSSLYGPPLTPVDADAWAPLGDDLCNLNGPHPFIGAGQLKSSDWEENGERVWDAMRALDYLLSRPDVDSRRILVTGLSMGGEVATITGALEPRISMVISAAWSPDAGVFYFISHGCAHWVYANSREYLDISDYHALIAARPLILLTGKTDNLYSKVLSSFFSESTAHFAGDKTVARRSRQAYSSNERSKFVHYLHYNGHTYQVGDTLSLGHPPPGGYEPYVRQPVRKEPTDQAPLTWQVEPRTRSTGRTLFDYIEYFFRS